MQARMPNKWPEDVYNYEAKEIVNPDIESLGLEEGNGSSASFARTLRMGRPHYKAKETMVP